MRSFDIVAAMCLMAGTAHADDPGQRDELPPSVHASTDVSGPALLDHVQAIDAANDRAFVLGTALVQPMGNVDMSLRSVVEHGAILGLAAGIGFGIELSVDSAWLGGTTHENVLGVGAKVRIVRRGTWAVSVDASVHKVSTDAGDYMYSTNYYMTGVKLTGCASPTCNALVTVGLGIAASKESLTTDGVFDTIAPVVTGSVVIGTGAFRPMLELAYADDAYGVIGARFGGRHVAFDCGVGFTSLGGNVGGGLMLGLAVRP